jgi:hypothetical protein
MGDNSGQGITQDPPASDADLVDRGAPVKISPAGEIFEQLANRDLSRSIRPRRSDRQAHRPYFQ